MYELAPFVLEAMLLYKDRIILSLNQRRATRETYLYILYFWLIHCEKSLFVLASRQKIPALRTEIPAVDTRTICLLPIQFF